MSSQLDPHHRSVHLPADDLARVAARSIGAPPPTGSVKRTVPEDGTDAPAPVVNVMIGRVEVRHPPITPPVQPPAESGPRPMSLTEYLDRRGTGRE